MRIPAAALGALFALGCSGEGPHVEVPVGSTSTSASAATSATPRSIGAPSIAWRKRWELPKDQRFCEAAEIVAASTQREVPIRSFRIVDGKLPARLVDRVGPDDIAPLQWSKGKSFEATVLSSAPKTEVALPIDRGRWVLARNTPEPAIVLAETEPALRAAWTSGSAGLPGRITTLAWNGKDRVGFVGDSSSVAGSAIGALDLAGKLAFTLPFTHTASVSDVAYDDAGSLWVLGGFRRPFELGDAKLEPGPPHTEKRIVPRLGVDVAVSSTDGTVTQDEVLDGFIARIDPGGKLAFAKSLHTGMSFTSGALVPEGAGVVMIGSVVGSVPEAMRGPLSSAPGKWTILARFDANGSVDWTQTLDGASYAHRLARSANGYVAFMGLEDRACEAVGWVSP